MRLVEWADVPRFPAWARLGRRKVAGQRKSLQNGAIGGGVQPGLVDHRPNS
jgi:hypothetical protein